MAEKKEAEIKVNDRRLFTAEGDLRADTVEEKPAPVVEASTQVASAVAPAPVAPATDVPVSNVPPPPTTSEQQAQHDAYKKSSRDLDTQVELGGHSAKDL